MTTQSFVFLSHNSADKPAVEEIQRRLESWSPPFHCWLDKDDLGSRGSWVAQIESALQNCEAAVLFFGPSGRGPMHELERHKLVERAARQRDSFWLVPVLLPGARKEDVEGFTSLFNWVDFSAGLDSPASLERLSKLLRGEAPGSISADDQITGEPYRGLERFDSEHAGFFFGRDRDIRRLCSAIEKLPFVSVIGASGSGKSSLVRAGLRTKLAQSIFPRLSAATTITVLPGSDPLRSLAEQLAAAAIPDFRRDERPERAGEYVRGLEENTGGLIALLSSLFAREGEFVLLVIDQFEEVFTHRRVQQDGPNAARKQTEHFVSLLSNLATNADPRFRLVITLRADFLARCLEFASLRELLQNEHNPQLLLGELDSTSLRDVIMLPAQHAGACFEKGLVERIFQDVADQHGSLPLLEHALKELWVNRRGRWLTNESYDASGGVAGALGKRADETLASLTAAQREIAKRIFLRLTTLGEGVSDTRRRVKLNELYPVNPASDPSDPRVKAIAEVIDKLRGKDARLIVTSDDGTAEVTHEALMQRWNHLRSWLENHRDEKRLHDRLRDATHEWCDTSPDDPDRRDSSFLWEGGRLDDAEQFQRDHPGALNEFEVAFVRASIDKREREKAEEDRRQERELELAHAAKAEAQARAVEAREAESRQKELTRFAKRRARLALSAFAAALIAAGVAAVFGWRAKQSSEVATNAKNAATDAKNAATEAESAARDALAKQLKMFTEPTAIGGRIAAAVLKGDSKEVNDALKELESSTAPYAMTSGIKECIKTLQEKVIGWKPNSNISINTMDSSSNDARVGVLHFAVAVRNAWSSQALEARAKALSYEIIVRPSYDRAIQVTRRLANNPTDREDLFEFERLYWSELVFLETDAVKESMIAFRNSLFHLPGSEKNDLKSLADGVEKACAEALKVETGGLL